MPVIQVHLIQGRSVDQKRMLVKKITEAVCESVNVPAESVHVMLTDMKREDYADAGILHLDR